MFNNINCYRVFNTDTIETEAKSFDDCYRNHCAPYLNEDATMENNMDNSFNSASSILEEK